MLDRIVACRLDLPGAIVRRQLVAICQALPSFVHSAIKTHKIMVGALHDHWGSYSQAVTKSFKARLENYPPFPVSRS